MKTLTAACIVMMLIFFYLSGMAFVKEKYDVATYLMLVAIMFKMDTLGK